MPLVSLVLVSLAVGWPTTCSTQAEWHAVEQQHGAAGGLVIYAEQRVLLAPDTCRDLRSRNSYRFGLALHALAHERQHVLGYIDEDYADCEGLRTIINVGIRAGFSPWRVWRGTVAFVSDDGAPDWMLPCHPF
jgi:hypothetical protein